MRANKCNFLIKKTRGSFCFDRSLVRRYHFLKITSFLKLNDHHDFHAEQYNIILYLRFLYKIFYYLFNNIDMNEDILKTKH